LAVRLPAQLRHFTSINDVRLWFELQESLEVTGFWAEWEYRPFGTKDAIVPDAIVSCGTLPAQRFAIEVDQASENASVVARKVEAYQKGSGDELAGVLLYVPGSKRLRSVVAACCRAAGICAGLRTWLIDLDSLWRLDSNVLRCISLDALAGGASPVNQSLAMILNPSPASVSPREERRHSLNPQATDTSPDKMSPKYRGTLDANVRMDDNPVDGSIQ
jgi:hypothetical protein